MPIQKFTLSQTLKIKEKLSFSGSPGAPSRNIFLKRVQKQQELVSILFKRRGLSVLLRLFLHSTKICSSELFWWVLHLRWSVTWLTTLTSGKFKGPCIKIRLSSTNISIFAGQFKKNELLTLLRLNYRAKRLKWQWTNLKKLREKSKVMSSTKERSLDLELHKERGSGGHRQRERRKLLLGMSVWLSGVCLILWVDDFWYNISTVW